MVKRKSPWLLCVILVLNDSLRNSEYVVKTKMKTDNQVERYANFKLGNLSCQLD
ncbi:hypothetical protein V6Z11_D08G141800 [Gossypium hirsutum]